MKKLNEVYKCEICGNIVELINVGGGELVCCGQPMNLLEEKSEDSSTEKHVPFIIKEDDKVTVKVGENTEHPMMEKHYIQWIELLADGKVYRRFLNPDDKPEAVFYLKADKVSAREYCNLHELWKSQK